MTDVQTFRIEKENVLTIVLDAFASGHIVRLHDTGSQPSEFQAIAASETIVLGPFNENRNYRVTTVHGSYTTAMTFAGTDDDAADIAALTAAEIAYDNETSDLVADDLQAAVDELKAFDDTLGTMALETAADYTDTAGLADVAISGDYADLDITPEANIAAASAIAEEDLETAVNAILALLIAKGLMAAP